MNMVMEQPVDVAGTHWFALRVLPQTERLSAFFLEQRGVETFVPIETRYRRRNRYAKRKFEAEFCVMPGYVFAGFKPRSGDASIDWRAVNQVKQVRGVVGHFERPWRLDARRRIIRGEDGRTATIMVPNTAFLRFMRTYRNGRLTAPTAEQFMRTHHEFRVGDEVDVVDGPYREMRVKVVEITGQAAKFILPLFGNAEQLVPVPLEYLEKAE